MKNNSEKLPCPRQYDVDALWRCQELQIIHATRSNGRNADDFPLFSLKFLNAANFQILIFVQVKFKKIFL